LVSNVSLVITADSLLVLVKPFSVAYVLKVTLTSTVDLYRTRIVETLG